MSSKENSLENEFDVNDEVFRLVFLKITLSYQFFSTNVNKETFEFEPVLYLCNISKHRITLKTTKNNLQRRKTQKSKKINLKCYSLINNGG